MRIIKNKNEQTHTITKDIQLLPFLLELFPNKSRNAVKSILTRSQVSVNGKTITQHNHPLTSGDEVQILNNQAAQKQSILNGITILHEDEDIIVIHKEAGVLSMAAKDPQERTAYRQLNDYVKEDNRKNRIFIVHRLDRDTSGVMLFAKSEEIKEALQENWHEIVKERVYTVVVEGALKKDEGTIESWLTESKSTKVYSSTYDNGGKHAITHYKKVGGNRQYTLLEANLETGRKNQIRVHMEALGHPVVGDRKYEATTNPLKRLGLHATTLAFTHPRTGTLVRYSAPVPKNFYHLVK